MGNQLYDIKRHEEAITAWQRAVDDGADFPTVFRNLGIALWNTRRDGMAARECYERALKLDSSDPRLVSEFDQLRAKLNDPLAERLAFLESHRDLVIQRDDCMIALAGLYNLTGIPEQALALVTSRRFHPWEGGEGSVLRQFTNAHLLLGQSALASGDAPRALDHFTNAMETPPSLGEAYHLLQAKADVNYWTGRALRAIGRENDAIEHFERSAAECGDFSEMVVTAHSPLSYYRGLSLRELGREDDARRLFRELSSFALSNIGKPASIDYFATSLPNLLVFEEDLQARRDAGYQLLAALACHGLEDFSGAASHLEEVLAFTNTDQRAADLTAELRRSV